MGKLILPNFELQYASSLKNILDNGTLTKNRTGIDTLVIQHQYFLLENIDLNFPIIKGKKVFPKMALKELMWILNGKDDVKWLQDRGVSYWNEWAATKENTGKNSNIPIGSIGKSYGYQMRNFNGHDQLQDLLDNIIKNPESRRLIINLWNSSDLAETTLPPCVYDYHFECEKFLDIDICNTSEAYNVSLHVKARSEDSFLGQPYDFMSAAWLLKIICYLATYFSSKNYFPKNIHYTADNYHLYVNHTKQVEKYLKNIEENKNNVINSFACIGIGRGLCKDLNDFLLVSDKNKYSNFWINKFYIDQYDRIEAPIAI